jgi:glycosyltransferase involved in cell wall biosynthesis
MKILFFQKMKGISGSERYLLNILPELKKRGLDVSFLLLQHPTSSKINAEFISDLESAQIPVFIINSYFSISPLLLVKILHLVKQKNFNILHTNLIHADFLGALIKRLFLPSIKILSTKHGYKEKFQAEYGLDYSKLRHDLFFKISKWAASQADSVVCISKSLENFYKASLIVEQKKISTILYGFDFSYKSCDQNQAKYRFGTPQLIVTGRLEPVKQHNLLLNILPKLKLLFPDLSVAMVGNGSLMEDLKKLSLELNIHNFVHWLGYQDNVHSYIANSDLMVVPSRAEGFGLVILEAWFHAKPVIGFDVPALCDIVEHNKDGILIQPFSTEKLLEELITILSDRKKMDQYGKNGQIKQKNLYGKDTMVSITAKKLYSLTEKDINTNIKYN